MKNIFGLDLGNASIGWAIIRESENINEKSSIINSGVKVIKFENYINTKTNKKSKNPQTDFMCGKGISSNAKRTLERSARRNLQRYKQRRKNLIEILKENNFINNDAILSEHGNYSTFETYHLRAKSVNEKISLEDFSRILLMINKKRGYKSSRKFITQNETESSGYLEAINNRSKELNTDKLTIGQYLMNKLNNDPNYSLKNQVFYRQDYLDEFNIIWESQKQYHKELTEELKEKIRDNIIFYQRNLKSQKDLISFCEFENEEKEIEINGKKKIITIGSKVCPKSSPLFQEFKIWQIINNIEVIDKDKIKRALDQDEKETLFAELSLKNKLTKTEVLKLLFKNYKELDLNYKDIDGNRTQASLFKAYQKIIELSGNGEYDFSNMLSDEIVDIVKTVFGTLGINTDILHFDSTLETNEFEKQPMYSLWHLLYSFNEDNHNPGNYKLISNLSKEFGFDEEYAKIIVNTVFQDDYGSLSTKAIKKILPHLTDGNKYDVACAYAGYNHSKESLTKEEIENKILKDNLDYISQNSLRSPIVEKILNQMVTVVNDLIKEYGKPDEIRIELTRQLKNSAKEREQQTKANTKTTNENNKYKELIRKEFGFPHVSKNYITRYKLYLELEENGFKTLYSNTYIPRDQIFSKEFDIEHIIPQAKLFDNSFSNKTLEHRKVNIDKSNSTAYDFVSDKYGANELEQYINRIDNLFKKCKISKTKYKKLKMKLSEIPNDFIDRDLRETQYISKKAKQMLLSITRVVTSTSGSITDKLRKDWGLIDIMQELNWNKYDKLGLTEIKENKEGKKLYHIKDWTKRNDHRHHAMDAIVIAFTKPSYIQYFNNLNARSDKSGSIYAIEQKEFYRNHSNKLTVKPPMIDFKAEVKNQLEKMLISIKAKNKVMTKNINITKKDGDKKMQLSPRGKLHKETVYGQIQQYVTKEEKVDATFIEEKINKVAKKAYREALLTRLHEFGGDTKKAFTGKNTLEKNPIYLDRLQTYKVPEKVKIVDFETIYTIRKDISPDLKIDKVIDVKVKEILQARLKEYNGINKDAFSNLEENPIWLNKEKGIKLKRVTISGVSNAFPLHSKKDKEGNLILSKDGNPQPVDFVSTGNNHHVAIYRDEKNVLQENVVTFFEATARVNSGLSIIDKTYNQDKGWQFLFSMKKDEYFVFPNEETGFNPRDIDLFNPINYSLISPNLFRVQKISTKNYCFMLHLETTIEDIQSLKDITYKSIRSLLPLKDIVKVRVNHIGQVVSVSEE